MGCLDFFFLGCSCSFNSSNFIYCHFRDVSLFDCFLSWFLINWLNAHDFRLFLFMWFVGLDGQSLTFFSFDDNCVLVDKLSLFNFSFLDDYSSILEFWVNFLELFDDKLNFRSFVLSFGNWSWLSFNWLNDGWSWNLSHINNFNLLGLGVLNHCDLLLGLLWLFLLHNNLIGVHHVTFSLLEILNICCVNWWQFSFDCLDNFINLFINFFEFFNIIGDYFWLSFRWSCVNSFSWWGSHNWAFIN